MAKLDITKQIHRIDEFIAKLSDPLHRQIMENYRRHTILEITGNTDEILMDELTVSEPVYLIDIEGKSLTLKGKAAVADFYSSLEDSEATVIVVEGQKLAVSDWGFASQAVYKTFMKGSEVLPKYGADPDKLYIREKLISVIWHYTSDVKLLGEHIFEHSESTRITEVPEEEFITLQEAREKLLPLLRPLPAFEPTPAV
ncbi:hypothetical protein GCM10022261_13390 [Brevibacterium daeguense]|uniref:SnoaL-like domain-containing protein n=1 Tax=Brevibacterium daeguense TaxID=909936 RepID=A0ABP8EIP1_9MICO|nr:hypothetical protein [Brevibacterium daeguense]